MQRNRGKQLNGKHQRALQKNQRYQGNFLCKEGHNKAQKWYRHTEAEDIKKRWQEYTEELYQKDLPDPDNHAGVITHLKPDILECEVKWAIGNITTNKTSEGDGIPVKLFQILQDDVVKVMHSICQQIWKTQQQSQDWKKVSFHSNPKESSNYHTISLISHASKVMLKILQARLQQYMNCELPYVQAGFGKGRGTRDQIAMVKSGIYPDICFIKILSVLRGKKSSLTQDVESR